MALDLLVDVVFTQARLAFMVMARAGGNESKQVSATLLADRETLTRSILESCTDWYFRTAEDLTATSRRLARYENLLNEILPMVSPEVRVLIEDARDNVSI
jgi:hypothetical protein